MNSRIVPLIALACLLSACGKNSNLISAQTLASNSDHDADQFIVEESIEFGHTGLETSQSPSFQIQSVTSSTYVSRFELYNASTGALLRTLNNGDVIDIAKDGASLTIRARAGGTGYQSIKFELDGQTRVFVDNNSPYLLGGNDGSEFVAVPLSGGAHTLKATVYTEDNAEGDNSVSSQISFTVVNQASTPPPVSSGSLAAFRSNVVKVAQAEADLGLCARTATDKYDALPGSAWCSEFVRWVYLKANVMKDSRSELDRLISWNRMQTYFTNKRMFLTRSQITKANSTSNMLAGNYLLLDTNRDGEPNHSALIVGVSSDFTKIYTIEGNYGNCTKRATRPFIVNGSLDSRIKGIGKIWE